MKLNTILSLLLLVVVLTVSSCSLQPPACVQDNVCSIDEKLKGDCNDCKPDFAAIEIATPESYYAPTIHYDQAAKTVDATVCIENNGGPYSGQIANQWHLSSRTDQRVDSSEEYVYYNSNDIQFSGNVNVDKGSIDQWFHLNLKQGKEEGVYCYSHTFNNVLDNPTYTVTFNVNYNQIVSERNFNNNQISLSAEGIKESYPDILIEKDIGSAQYTHSRIENDEQLGDLYVATYEANGGIYAYVALNDSNELIDYLKEALGDNATIVPVVDGYAYSYQDGKGYALYFWPTSKDQFVAIEGRSTLVPVVLNAYLAKYPSNLKPLVSVDSEEVSLALGEKHTTVIGGKKYDVSIVSGSISSNSIVVNVNGQRKTMYAKDTETINGLQICAREIGTIDHPKLNAFSSLTLLNYDLYEDPVCSELYSKKNGLLSKPETTYAGGSFLLGGDYYIKNMGYNLACKNETRDYINLTVNGKKLTVYDEGSNFTVDGFTFYVDDYFFANVPVNYSELKIGYGAIIYIEDSDDQYYYEHVFLLDDKYTQSVIVNISGVPKTFTFNITGSDPGGVCLEQDLVNSYTVLGVLNNTKVIAYVPVKFGQYINVGGFNVGVPAKDVISTGDLQVVTKPTLSVTGKGATGDYVGQGYSFKPDGVADWAQEAVLTGVAYWNISRARYVTPGGWWYSDSNQAWLLGIEQDGELLNTNFGQSVVVDGTKPFFFRYQANNPTWPTGILYVTANGKDYVIPIGQVNKTSVINVTGVTSTTALNAYWATSQIGIVAVAISASTTNSDAIVLRNNLPYTITITSVELRDSVSSYSSLGMTSQIMPAGTALTISKNSISSVKDNFYDCTAGSQYNLYFKINYTEGPTNAQQTFIGVGNSYQGTCSP